MTGGVLVPTQISDDLQSRGSSGSTIVFAGEIKAF